MEMALIASLRFQAEQGPGAGHTLRYTEIPDRLYGRPACFAQELQACHN